MYNWSVDEKYLKKFPKKYRLWRITQLINYGLEEEEKLDREEVKKAWSKIKNDLDPYKARAVEYLLWGKQYSLPANLTFWNWHKVMPISQKIII